MQSIWNLLNLDLEDFLCPKKGCVALPKIQPFIFLWFSTTNTPNSRKTQEVINLRWCHPRWEGVRF